jgi:hypothetical protein
MIEPTERSIPAVMMMKVIGRATSPTSAISRPWLSRLPVVRNRSVWVDSTKSEIRRIAASTISWPIRYGTRPAGAAGEGVAIVSFAPGAGGA